MKKIVAMIPLFIFWCLSIPLWADQTKETIKINVDGNQSDVRVLNHDYDNNMYISMNDLLYSLNDTGLEFSVDWTVKDGQTYIVLSKNELSDEWIDEYEEHSITETDDNEEDTADKVNYTRKRILICIDGNDYSLYMIPVTEKDYKDCYVNLGDFALIMNADISCGNNEIYINTKGEFDFNKYDFANSGIQYMADSCIVADATTGNIYYEQNPNETVTIASTTKLMTYLIIKDAIEEGKISEKDTVVFSKKASELSKTSSGVVRLEEGQSADIEDVISAMLICSSNECSLALAEHLCKNEQDFVDLMNHKAAALGLSTECRFYNPHGLPMYEEEVLTVKKQNRMSANDMLILVEHILDKYPEITEITSIKKTNLVSLANFEAKNTNILLYNVPGTVGLKTGTTDKAGSCLVSAYEAYDLKQEPHYIVSIVYGAENMQTQSYTSMVLMKYGIQRFNASELGIVPDSGKPTEIPDNLEGFIGAVVNTARRNSK